MTAPDFAALNPGYACCNLEHEHDGREPEEWRLDKPNGAWNNPF